MVLKTIERRIIGFHIDMNMAQYRADYLEAWLTTLSEMGYNTVVWELEGGIEWQTIPEAHQPDALTKDEFRKLLEHAKGLGLDNIPLLQTLGHAEYVLRHEKYAGLRAHPDDTTQYNPLHPAVVLLLHDWIAEYLDLFGEVRYFHIGCDEARRLDHVQQSARNKHDLSVSQIFIQHVNTISEPLIERGATPIIWADMALHHNGAIDELSRDVMLFDWMYDVWRGNGRVYIWGDKRGLRNRNEFTPKDLDLFGKYLFPNGDAPGVDPETFYTADFLADKGFKVVTCPGSSCDGDNVFSPRHKRQLHNTWDSAAKGLKTPALCGTVLTSWSVHLHPWELQHAHIAAVGFLSQNPESTMAEFRDRYVKCAYGLEDDRFWEAVEGLSEPCLFTHTQSLGIGKACLPVPADHVEKTLASIIAEGGFDEHIETARARRRAYARSLDQIRSLMRVTSKGEYRLELWELAARNLTNRAEASQLILLSRTDGFDPQAHRDQASRILEQMRALREEYERVYSGMIRPSRRALMIGYMFDSVEAELVRLADE